MRIPNSAPQFAGITRVTGEPKATAAYIKANLLNQPITIQGNVSRQERILLDGQDAVHFMKAKLGMHLDAEELDLLNPATFTEVKQDAGLKTQYLEWLDELQGTVKDVEEQQSAEECDNPDEFVSLGTLMSRYFDKRKALDGKALDGTPIMDVEV